MKKLVILAAAAMGVWGCSHSSTAGQRSDAHQPTYQRPLERRPQPADQNEKERAQSDRRGAPTVYDGEATGGSGHSVTTPEGQTWTPESAPGNTVAHPPGPSSPDSQSDVSDEGPSPDAARR
ncbi:hypothetical protein [Melittangium boletus]|uniref:hypothetical protein n=1 Tax=Melittangium boletus TaxID=83453 RepID=UPI003DA281F4